MKINVSLLLFTAFSHTLHISAMAGTMHSLTNAFKPPSSTFHVNGRIEKRLQELAKPSSLHFPEQNKLLGLRTREQQCAPLAGLDTDHKCLEGRCCLQYGPTADSPGLNLYDTTHSNPELGISSQEHLNHPLSSAASGSTWSQSLLFSLLTWSKPFQSPRKREVPQNLLKYNENTIKATGSSAFNVTFQKCAEVNGKTLNVRLMITNLDVQMTFNVSQLTIQDTISVLSILSNVGNETEMGIQTYTKESLQGEHYIINYTAVLKAGEPEDEKNISLPAYLTIGSRTQGNQILIGPIRADFILMVKAATQVSPNHGVHFAGFIVAFIVSLALVCLILITTFHIGRVTGRNPCLQRVKRKQSNESSSVSDDGAKSLQEYIRLQDRVIDILLLEDPQNMTRALNDLHVLNTIQMDTDLEYHRKKLNLDAILLLLRSFKHNKDLSPLLEERFKIIFREQFEETENRLSMEHEEMLAILAAQSNQDTRHKMEALYKKQQQEDREVELLVQNVDDEVAAQWNKDLEQLHTFEQDQLKCSQLVTHEEASGNAQREMVVRLRQVLQRSVCDQLKEVIRMEELDATSGRQLLQESWHIQFQLDMLMDQQLAFQRKILEENFFIKRNLVKRIHHGVDHRKHLLNTAALHIADLIRLVKNAGYLTEDQVESLLEMVHQEILRVKLGLDDVMDQEKILIHCKLISERRKHIIKTVGEHECQENELSSLLNTSGERRSCHNKYLLDWHDLLKNQAAELKELVEQLDKDALDRLELLGEQLAKDASLKIKKIDTKLGQELLNLGVPKDYLKQVAESQEKEANLLHKKKMRQDENENHKANELLEQFRQELSNQLQSEIEEQKFLRHQTYLLLQNMMKSVLVLSEEEVQQVMQSFLDVFCQMDKSLALPKLRERSILQANMTDWRKAKMEKLELRWRKQDKVNGKERGHSDQNTLVTLQEHTRQKIKLYTGETERADEEMSKVRLQKDRFHQCNDNVEAICWTHAIAGNLCSIASHTALLGHNSMLNLQAMKHRCPDSSHSDVANCSLSFCQIQLQNIRRIKNLQDQELKLAAYLIQQLDMPVHILQALLKLLLPNIIQEELNPFVHRIYPKQNVSNGMNKDTVDKERKRKLWKSLELKLRNKLIGENLGNVNIPCSRKGSILKKKRLQLLKQVSFSQSHGSSEFLPDHHPELINEGAGQMLKLADTGEKVFVFRNKEGETCSKYIPPKKKKRNFLNLKRSAVGNWDEH
ncbi:limbin-like [Leucoraja erinacea]|uniref:limbin-like n=1 Tax=Leucoraja erinaceus TaxID=7782 RepID=UPI00245469F0|nr:limbin-like [Leucoraja erinacea]